MNPTRLVVPLLLVAALTAGCGGEDDAGDPKPDEITPTVVPKSLQPPANKPVHDPRTALALVPADTEVLTLTDYDEIRDRLGYPDLTSDDLMTDRTTFWERADRDAVLLAQGLLRDQHSRLWLDYGFTQDDVDWEARFSGPDGPGYVLAFRPGQDMGEVSKAVEDDVAPLEDATVLEEQHLVVSGIADEGEPVLAADADFTDLLAVGVESQYLRTSCIPVNEALGPDATYEDQEALTAKYDVSGLNVLDAFAINFEGSTATARTDLDRTDLQARTDLIGFWPETGTIGWKDAFDGKPVNDESSGRIGWHVRNPVAAANLVLSDHLPFAVCNEMVPLDEPTGL